MFEISKIINLHDYYTSIWHDDPSLLYDKGEEIYKKIVFQHGCNFAIWHLEDTARIPDAPDALIANVKRQIDTMNQKRNDCIEVVDQHLLKFLERNKFLDTRAILHSETPGLIIDRLSVLALKIYHTEEEIRRPDAPVGHAERNHQRYQILEQQRNDLADCLKNLWDEIVNGHRQFKIYRQLKMYNDPTLNPEIYRSSPSK